MAKTHFDGSVGADTSTAVFQRREKEQIRRDAYTHEENSARLVRRLKKSVYVARVLAESVHNQQHSTISLLLLCHAAPRKTITT